MMRFHVFSAFVALLILCTGADARAFSALKVGVYNIHGGVGTDGNTDLVRISRVLRSAAPDVVGLNEVNRYWVGTDQDAAIAAHLGPEWTAHFGKTLNKWYTLSDYGNAIVTRLPVLSTQTWLFSEYPDQERRGMIRVTVEKDGQPVHLFNTHMGLNAPMRQQHAREILQIMNGFSGHKVLMGDFNEQRTGTSIEILASQLSDAFGDYGIGPGNTFSATNPNRRIDFIWLGSGVEATSCYVPMFPDARVASDHLPVFANLTVPGSSQPVINELSVRVNGGEHLTARDVVAADPDAYTQGSVILSTSGTSGPNEILADNLAVDTLVPVYREDFSVPVGTAPPDWKFLYVTEGKSYMAGVARLGNESFWRQRSEGYVKFHYAPEPYPQYKNYEVSARIKTLDTGGGSWRLLAYNYPATDTAYETYKIEVRHNAGALPVIRLMKGGTQLATTPLPIHDVDLYDWNTYALQVAEDEFAAHQTTRRLVAYVNGKRVASAVDVIAGVPDPNEYSQGSVGFTTIGGNRGWCEAYLDDLQVRQWQPVFAENFDEGDPTDWEHLYTTAGTAASGEVLQTPSGYVWHQQSEAYTRYHYAPVPYPDWQTLRFRADVQTVGFGAGKWRMKAYNYPANDTGYETYKLEVHAGGGSPRLRIMKGGSLLTEKTMQQLGINPMNWQKYEFNVHTFQDDGRVIHRYPQSAVSTWTDY